MPAGLMFNGIDLHTYNFNVISDDGRACPDVQSERLEFERMDGSICLSDKFKPRNLKIEGQIFGETTQLTGTVSITSGSTTVTGSGTLFTTQLQLYNQIIINNSVRTIVAITSDTLLTVDSNYLVTAAGQAIYIKDSSDAINKKDAFIKLISTAKTNAGEFKFPDTNRSVFAKLSSNPFVSSMVGTYFNTSFFKITLNLICDDPFAYGDARNEQVIYPATNIKAYAPSSLISSSKGLTVKDPDISLYPTTLVNLLGVDGNFEDANTLQNGWLATNTTNSKTTGVFGTKSQKCVATSTDGQHYIYRALANYGIANHKYFFCAYVKTANGKCRFYTQYRNSAGDFIGSSSVSNIFSNTNFIKMYGTQEILSMYSTPTFNFFFAILKADNTVTYPGTNEEINIDGAMVVDLTNMGDLPVSLRRFFNNTSYTTWSSLATTSNITAGGRTQTGEAWLSELLPFADSIATVGWNYTNGAVTTTIENRGENLFKIQEFKDYINTYDSTAFYFKDEGLDVVDFNHTGYYVKPFMRGKFKPKTQYVFKATAKISATGNNLIIYFVYTDGTTGALTYTNTAYESKLIITASGKTLDYMFITFGNGLRSRISLSDFMIYEGTTTKAYTPALNNVLSFNTTLFSHLGNEDMIYYDNGPKKLKRWHYETVVKSTTFANTTYNGTGSCILIKSTGEVYYSTITNKDIAEGSIPDGTYTVWYCLVSPTVESVYYTGDLKLYNGNNQIIVSNLLSLALIGKQKYLEV